MTRSGALRALLAWLAVYHVGVGVLALASPAQALALGHAIYGVRADAGPAALALMRPLGAYAVAIGFLAACAARDPVRNRVGLDAVALLMFVRAFYRTLAAASLAEGLGIPGGQNAVNVALLLLQGGALVALRPRD